MEFCNERSMTELTRAKKEPYRLKMYEKNRIEHIKPKREPLHEL